MATNSTVNQGTQRKDNWRLAPLLTFLGLGGFIVYATWAAFHPGPVSQPYYTLQGTNYLSPFFSPNVYEIIHLIGPKIGLTAEQFINNAGYWVITPGLFILWAPAGFRATCYYYRKAYYRSFFTAPAACAVDTGVKSPLIALLGTGKRYMGEKVFPMVLQNLHRYFFYVAALFILILGWDAFVALFGATGTGLEKRIDWTTLRVGLGSIVLGVNVLLLALYTFGCHSYRHILGGQVDCFSTCPMGAERHHALQRQSVLNAHHMEFAWMSLFSVGFADLYVRMCAMGVWQDPVLLNWHWAWW